jgi:hypothetical protein
MKNVTVTLDEETARWARIEAAKRDMSMSSLIRALIEQSMAGQESYEAAMLRYLGRPARVISRRGPYPSREELHDRAGLR